MSLGFSPSGTTNILLVKQAVLDTGCMETTLTQATTYITKNKIMVSLETSANLLLTYSLCLAHPKHKTPVLFKEKKKKKIIDFSVG
jgi:hypothetical protein